MGLENQAGHGETKKKGRKKKKERLRRRMTQKRGRKVQEPKNKGPETKGSRGNSKGPRGEQRGTAQNYQRKKLGGICIRWEGAGGVTPVFGRRKKKGGVAGRVGEKRVHSLCGGM